MGIKRPICSTVCRVRVQMKSCKERSGRRRLNWAAGDVCSRGAYSWGELHQLENWAAYGTIPVACSSHRSWCSSSPGLPQLSFPLFSIFFLPNYETTYPTIPTSLMKSTRKMAQTLATLSCRYAPKAWAELPGESNRRRLGPKNISYGVPAWSSCQLDIGTEWTDLKVSVLSFKASGICVTFWKRWTGCAHGLQKKWVSGHGLTCMTAGAHPFMSELGLRALEQKLRAWKASFVPSKSQWEATNILPDLSANMEKFKDMFLMAGWWSQKTARKP